MSGELNEIEPGAEGPDFELDSNTGSKVRLSDFRSRHNVLLYFMREFT